MKFKELPEGYYYVHKIADTVYVERLENPEAYPRYITELEAVKVEHDGRHYHKHGELLDDMEIEFKTYEDVRKERKSTGARHSHITRRLKKNEPLTGKTLELALELVDARGDDDFSKCLRGIGNKMKAGQPLNEYENHLMIDMVLPHTRLG